MSYADPVEFGANRNDRIRSAVIVTAIQGSAIAALIAFPAAVITQLPQQENPKVINIRVPPPPAPPEPAPKQSKPTTQIDAPTPKTAVPRQNPIIAPPLDIFVAPPSFGDAGGKTITGQPSGTGTEMRIPEPVIVKPKLDQRYARFFQPDYPTHKLRASEEGQVKINVLVGTDGRVRKVQQLSASDPAFWRATERHAIKRWRFTPGTRDGQPAEQWFAVTVAFTIND